MDDIQRTESEGPKTTAAKDSSEQTQTETAPVVPLSPPPWLPFLPMFPIALGTLGNGILFKNLYNLAIAFPDTFGAGSSAFRILDIIFWILGCLVLVILLGLYAWKAVVAPRVIRWEWETGRRNLFWTPWMAICFLCNGAPKDVVDNPGALVFLRLLWWLCFAWQILAGIVFYDVWIFGNRERVDRPTLRAPPSSSSTSNGVEKQETSVSIPPSSTKPISPYPLDATCFFTIIDMLLLSTSAVGLSQPKPMASLTLSLGIPLMVLAYFIVISNLPTLPPARSYNATVTYLFMAPLAVACQARANLVSGGIPGDLFAESMLWLSCFAYLMAVYTLGGLLPLLAHMKGLAGWAFTFPTAANAAVVARYMLESGAAPAAVWAVVGILVAVSCLTTIVMLGTTLWLLLKGRLRDAEFDKVWRDGAHTWNLRRWQN